jgi:hypothetical protein
MLVENDACLLQLSCYIRRNPLRAGLVQRQVDYRWSSYRVYAHRQEPVGWLATGLILKQWLAIAAAGVAIANQPPSHKRQL